MKSKVQIEDMYKSYAFQQASSEYSYLSFTCKDRGIPYNILIWCTASGYHFGITGVAWGQYYQGRRSPPNTHRNLSKEDTFFLFKTSSHGLFESSLYCIDSIIMSI